MSKNNSSSFYNAATLAEMVHAAKASKGNGVTAHSGAHSVAHEQRSHDSINDHTTRNTNTSIGGRSQYMHTMGDTDGQPSSSLGALATEEEGRRSKLTEDCTPYNRHKKEMAVLTDQNAAADERREREWERKKYNFATREEWALRVATTMTTKRYELPKFLTTREAHQHHASDADDQLMKKKSSGYVSDERTVLMGRSGAATQTENPTMRDVGLGDGEVDALPPERTIEIPLNMPDIAEFPVLSLPQQLEAENRIVALLARIEEEINRCADEIRRNSSKDAKKAEEVSKQKHSQFCDTAEWENRMLSAVTGRMREKHKGAEVSGGVGGIGDPSDGRKGSSAAGVSDLTQYLKQHRLEMEGRRERERGLGLGDGSTPAAPRTAPSHSQSPLMKEDTYYTAPAVDGAEGGSFVHVSALSDALYGGMDAGVGTPDEGEPLGIGGGVIPQPLTPAVQHILKVKPILKGNVEEMRQLVASSKAARAATNHSGAGYGSDSHPAAASAAQMIGIVGGGDGGGSSPHQTRRQKPLSRGMRIALSSNKFYTSKEPQSQGNRRENASATSAAGGYGHFESLHRAQTYGSLSGSSPSQSLSPGATPTSLGAVVGGDTLHHYTDPLTVKNFTTLGASSLPMRRGGGDPLGNTQRYAQSRGVRGLEEPSPSPAPGGLRSGEGGFEGALRHREDSEYLEDDGPLSLMSTLRGGTAASVPSAPSAGGSYANANRSGERGGMMGYGAVGNTQSRRESVATLNPPSALTSAAPSLSPSPLYVNAHSGGVAHPYGDIGPMGADLINAGIGSPPRLAGGSKRRALGAKNSLGDDGDDGAKGSKGSSEQWRGLEGSIAPAYATSQAQFVGDEGRHKGTTDEAAQRTDSGASVDAAITQLVGATDEDFSPRTRAGRRAAGNALIAGLDGLDELKSRLN